MSSITSLLSGLLTALFIWLSILFPAYSAQQVYKSTNSAAGTFGNGLLLKPSLVSGLSLDLESDLGITTVSGKVSTWADQSGNSRNFTQSTSTARPVYTSSGGPNNKPYISGNGSTNWLNSTWTPGSAGTVIMVARNTRSNLTSPTGQIDSLLSASDTSFNGLRLESFNYFNSTTQRYVAGSAATGTVIPYKNGFQIGGLFSSTYLAYNNWDIITLTWTGVTANMGAARLLANADGSLFADNDIVAVLAYNSVLSASDQALAESYLSWKYKLQHISTSNKVIITSGDSLTRGYGLDVDGSYPYQLYGLLGSNSGYFMYNEGVDGSTLLDTDSRAAAAGGIDTLTFGGNGLHARPIVYLVLWAGTNDIYVNGDTAATAYSRLATNVTNRKATGKYDKIIVVNCIPRGSSTTGWSDYNTQISTNWSTLQADGADILVDVTTDTAFDQGTDPSNTTYYQADLTHLTNAGEAKIAALVKTAILAVGG